MIDGKWERRKILIWGKTRPELSKTYREIVCTGGVFEDTRRLVRLYPIPLRYMDDEHIFKKYQWIEAFVTKATSDPRPESYKIRADGISVGETIPAKSGNWDARAEWIMQDENIFQSVEALQERQKIDKTSLGLVKPFEILDVTAQRVNKDELENSWRRYQASMSQLALPLDDLNHREIKPLTPAEFVFKIQFRCNDENCKIMHNFSVRDWEIDALYFRCKKNGDSPQVAAQKTVDKLAQEVCSDDKDLYFYLGNISNHPYNFMIAGLWWPKKKDDSATQLSLFEG